MPEPLGNRDDRLASGQQHRGVMVPEVVARRAAGKLSRIGCGVEKTCTVVLLPIQVAAFGGK